MIYLDNAATTFPKPDAVYQAMDKANRELAVNAGRGSYTLAREATKIIDETKHMLLRLVHAEGIGKVAFTPSITIALNEILQGIDFHTGDNLYISPYEHNAVARVAHLLETSMGVNVIQMPLNESLLEIDIDKLQYMFSHHKPKCVCCIHVSNVTGYVLPIDKIFDLAKPYGAITILDTAQSLGLIDIDAISLNLDFLAFAGHKTLYGPFGIGGFIDLRGTTLRPVISGGTGSDSLNVEMPKESPQKYESSSMNVVAIAGLNAALNILDVQANRRKEEKLLDYLIAELGKVENVITYLPPREKHICIVSFNVRGYKAEEIGEILDADFDIAVRTGYHCAPFIHKHLADIASNGTVRVGISQFVSENDIDILIEALRHIVED